MTVIKQVVFDNIILAAVNLDTAKITGSAAFKNIA
jgi:hypothetical protein